LEEDIHPAHEFAQQQLLSVICFSSSVIKYKFGSLIQQTQQDVALRQTENPSR
jgi:hypothetical protein